jgi:hypothetical protein
MHPSRKTASFSWLARQHLVRCTVACDAARGSRGHDARLDEEATAQDAFSGEASEADERRRRRRAPRPCRRPRPRLHSRKSECRETSQRPGQPVHPVCPRDEPKPLGIESCPFFARQTDGNGCVEKFIRTQKRSICTGSSDSAPSEISTERSATSRCVSAMTGSLADRPPNARG